MNLWLDYDDTLSVMSADAIKALKLFIDALDPKHCAIVTYRDSNRIGGNVDIRKTADALNVPILFTAGQAKAKCVPDGDQVWLDDRPESILFDARDIASMVADGM